MGKYDNGSFGLEGAFPLLLGPILDKDDNGSFDLARVLLGGAEAGGIPERGPFLRPSLRQR